jgi:hypothetical protein
MNNPSGVQIAGEKLNLDMNLCGPHIDSNIIHYELILQVLIDEYVIYILLCVN